MMIASVAGSRAGRPAQLADREAEDARRRRPAAERARGTSSGSGRRRRDALATPAGRAPDRAPRAEQPEDVAEQQRHERDADPEAARRPTVGARLSLLARRCRRGRRRRDATNTSTPSAPSTTSTTSGSRNSRRSRQLRSRGVDHSAASADERDARARSPRRPRTATRGSAGRRGRRCPCAKTGRRSSARDCSLRTTTAPPDAGPSKTVDAAGADYLSTSTVDVPRRGGLGGGAGFGGEGELRAETCASCVCAADRWR